MYLYCLNDPINRTDPTGEWSLTEISGTMGIKGFVFGSLLGGTRNALLGESIWKGALSGGLAAGTPAFFGTYGVMAALASGGINAGVSAALDRRSVERVVAETLGGMAFGSIMYGVTTWSIDNYMYANLIPAGLDKDFHKLFDPLMGSAGGDLLNAISTLIWGGDANDN